MCDDDGFAQGQQQRQAFNDHLNDGDHLYHHPDDLGGRELFDGDNLEVEE